MSMPFLIALGHILKWTESESGRLFLHSDTNPTDGGGPRWVQYFDPSEDLGGKRGT